MFENKFIHTHHRVIYHMYMYMYIHTCTCTCTFECEFSHVLCVCVYIHVCSDHYLIHMRQAGVDVEEALQTMSLMRQRLDADVQASVSTVRVPMQ